MNKQPSPAVSVIVIIIVLAILAGIWHMIYGQDHSDAIVHEGVLAEARYIPGAWNQWAAWELSFEGGSTFLVVKQNAPDILQVGQQYEVLRSSSGYLSVRAAPAAERPDGAETERKHEL